jgi:hypothetical protein
MTTTVLEIREALITGKDGRPAPLVICMTPPANPI